MPTGSTRRGTATPVELLVLGDSIAAGLGAELPDRTLGARLAKGLGQGSCTERSGCARRPRSGAETSASPTAGAAARAYRPEVAVIIVGGNDVTHRVPVDGVGPRLVGCIAALTSVEPPWSWSAPVRTSVRCGRCPSRCAPSAREPRRQLAAASGRPRCRAVPRRSRSPHVVGPFFITNPDEMFSLDRFHPSAMGYKRTAKAILPSVLAAIGVRDERAVTGTTRRRGPVQASAQTELHPDVVGSAERVGLAAGHPEAARLVEPTRAGVPVEVRRHAHHPPIGVLRHECPTVPDRRQQGLRRPPLREADRRHAREPTETVHTSGSDPKLCLDRLCDHRHSCVGTLPFVEFRR